MTLSNSLPLTPKAFLAGVMMLALGGMIIADKGNLKDLAQAVDISFSVTDSAASKAAPRWAKDCVTPINESGQLSREQILQLLAVPERGSKERVREIVQAPYCELASLNIRAGVEAKREAYPLAFDPGTTIVLLYENDEYAGYRFKH